MKSKLLYSEDSGLLNFEIKKILDNKKVFSWTDDKEKLMNDLVQINMFEEPTTYIVKNFDVLCSKSNWDLDKKYVLEILNLDNDLKIVFIHNSSKINISYIKDCGVEIIEIKKLTKWNINNFILSVSQYINIKIPNSILNYLVTNFSLDSNLIFNELVKLKSHNLNALSLDDISHIINFGSENMIFNLINMYLNEDNEKLVLCLQKFDSLKENFHELFNIFVSQLYLLKLFIESYAIDPNFSNIARKFNAPLFQVTNWSKFIVKYKTNIIVNLLNNLLKLEIDVIKNNKDIQLSFKLFLINGVI